MTVSANQHSIQFVCEYKKNMNLFYFIPKRYITVLLISSMLDSEFKDKGNNKPEIVYFYNATKSGVDTLYYKCSIYSTNRRTWRWPLAIAIFYHHISLSCSNSDVIYSNIQPAIMERFNFKKERGFSLIKKHQWTRLKRPNLSKELEKKVTGFLSQISSKIPDFNLMGLLIFWYILTKIIIVKKITKIAIDVIYYYIYILYVICWEKRLSLR